jgi:hypothetical protein
MVESNDKVPESGFHRQRRNLIVGSLTLFFVQIADLHIGPRGSVLAFEITIGKPALTLWFLWVAVMYWAVRYFQYHLTETPTGFRDSIRSRLEHSLRKHAIATLRRTVPAVVPQRPQLEPGDTCELTPFNFSIKKRKLWEVIAECQPTWNVFHGSNQLPSHQGMMTGVVFRGFDLIRARTYAYSYTILMTPIFTDFGLPYVIFACPVVLQIYTLLR